MIKFSGPLHEGTLIKRYKRFFADVRLTDGQIVVAHCPNTGSMKTCGEPGDQVFLSHNPSEHRKLHYTWELTATAGGYIGVNTSLPNKIVANAIMAGAVAELANYTQCQTEVKYGQNSRIDLLLSANDSGQKPCYVEIKNTTLLHGDEIVFPDAVTERGRKHLQELAAVVKNGGRSVMFYLVNRPDGKGFGVAEHIDPEYTKTLTWARQQGVEILAYRALTNLEEIGLGKKVPIKI